MALSSIEPELWAIYVLHCKNRDCRLFCSCHLDLDPMTFIYELDLCSPEIHQMCKSELPMSRLSTVIVWHTDMHICIQTDRHTERHDRNYTPVPRCFAGGRKPTQCLMSINRTVSWSVKSAAINASSAVARHGSWCKMSSRQRCRHAETGTARRWGKSFPRTRWQFRAEHRAAAAGLRQRRGGFSVCTLCRYAGVLRHARERIGAEGASPRPVLSHHQLGTPAAIPIFWQLIYDIRSTCLPRRYALYLTRRVMT